MSKVLLIGNPNVGKSTLFNALTQGHAKVGNYPGVTIERFAGSLTLREKNHAPKQVEVVDLPGSYSLLPRAEDERMLVEELLTVQRSEDPFVVVAVVDAKRLTRSLYLALEAAELGFPVVVALTMLGEGTSNAIDMQVLNEQWSVPSVAVDALRGSGLQELENAVARALREPPSPRVRLDYGAEITRWVQALACDPDFDDVRPERAALARVQRRSAESNADEQSVDFYWLLWWARQEDRLVPGELDVEQEVIVTRYRALDALTAAMRGSAKTTRVSSVSATSTTTSRTEAPSPTTSRTEAPGAEFAGKASRATAAVSSTSNSGSACTAPSTVTRTASGIAAPEAGTGSQTADARIDRWLVHPVWGLTFFALVMMVLFTALFAWSEPFVGALESGLAWLQSGLIGVLPAGLLRSFLVEGVVGGVGNVLVFLPQIAMLFLFLGLLEDSGYLARVAYLMDRIMRACGGLPGRAFIPMLSGFACAVPAILATRTMERRRDRLLTILVIPLMSCSARLPVYTLVLAAMFPAGASVLGLPLRPVLLFALYAFSTLTALLAAAVLGRTLVQGRRLPTIFELPSYRLPRLGSTWSRLRRRCADFVREAGGPILLFTVVVWALLSFPRGPAAAGLAEAVERQGQTGKVSETVSEADNGPENSSIAHSYGGKAARLLEPVMAPLGFDWKLTLGILGAFSAREVFVSTMALVYGIDADAEEAIRPLSAHLRAERSALGVPQYSPWVGLSLMVFFALACQCMSTLAVTYRETRSLRWPVVMFAYMTLLAWCASWLVMHICRPLATALL